MRQVLQPLRSALRRDALHDRAKGASDLPPDFVQPGRTESPGSDNAMPGKTAGQGLGTGVPIDHPLYWEPSKAFLRWSAAFLLVGTAIFEMVLLSVPTADSIGAFIGLALMRICNKANDPAWPTLARRGQIASKRGDSGRFRG